MKRGNDHDARRERALERIRQLLESRGLRLTSERALIVSTALGMKGHFNASTLMSCLNERGRQRVSLSTIYRMLPLMAEAGVLSETPSLRLDGQCFEDVFEQRAHEHLLCVGCGILVEFQLPPLSDIEQGIIERFGFLVTHRYFELRGLCGKCQERERARERDRSSQAARDLTTET